VEGGPDCRPERHQPLPAGDRGLRRAPRLASMAGEKIDLYERALRDHRVYIETYGNDPEEIRTWKWPG